MIKLSEIAGQNVAKKVLEAGLGAGGPATAYLFTGPDGVGKRTMAYAWAQTMMCEIDTIEACGVCVPCRKVANGSHPDLISLAPSARDKKVKREIDITHIRELVSRLAYKPYEAKRKIVIIDEADTMNLASANAFLKTLEEPPGDTVVILIAVNTGKLPLTIISRCLSVRFHPLDYDTILKLIKAKSGLSSENAALSASFSRGSPGRALSGSVEVSRQVRDMVIAFFSDADRFMADDYKLAVKLDRPANRSVVDQFLMSAVELTRDMVVVKTDGKCDSLVNRDIKTTIKTMAGRYSVRRLFRVYEVLREMIEAREWNINPLLIVSLLAMELKR